MRHTRRCKDHPASRQVRLPSRPRTDVEGWDLRCSACGAPLHPRFVHDENQPPERVLGDSLRADHPLNHSRLSPRQLRGSFSEIRGSRMNQKTSAANDRALAFLRICVGPLFLIFGHYKGFGRAFTREGGFQFWVNRFLQDGAYPFMVPVLKGFVLPHASAISFLVAFGELAIGISMLVGLWTKPASIFGIVY